MSHEDEHLERLISRSLDGALSADEQLELDRELIRNPEAHRLMERCRAIDELAGAALEDAVARPDSEVEVPTPARNASVRRVKPRAFNRGWLLVPGAIAAAILAIVIPRPTFTDQNGAITDASNGQPTTMPIVAPNRQTGPGDLMRPVSSAPSVRRHTGRELIGVVGDDGNLYWIEVERTRTIRLPRRRPVSSGSLDEM